MPTRLTLVMTSLLLVLIFFALGKAHVDRRPAEFGENPFQQSPSPRRLSVVSFNVENLFDTEHDPGRQDFEFLPIEHPQSAQIRDWNDWAVRRKLQAIATTILQVHNRGPDILVLQEVENFRILDRLIRGPLARAQYRTRVLIENNDPRGIDVAVVSRLPLAGKPRLHAIPGQGRGILEVPLQDGASILTILAFHFPSQYQPRLEREHALEALANLIKGRKNIIAAGDGNLNHSEESLREKYLSQFGQVTHELGCKTCRGTHSFRGQWNFLDWIFFSKDLLPRVVTDSITTLRWNIYQTTKRGIPIRFNSACQGRICYGVSDHLPIFAEINRSENAGDTTIGNR